MLESALARCVHKLRYERQTGIPALAAALAFGLARNPAFHDGNKRIALIASFTFARLNGWTMVATEADAYEAFMLLAAGKMSEQQLAEWFTKWAVRARPSAAHRRPSA
jgi:death-on-curing protein